MSYRTLLPGHSYAFLYPRHNFEGVQSGLESRRCRVESIRDCLAEPLDQLTVAENPLLRRGRFLITGLDIDAQAERSFYVESMIAVQDLSESDSLRGNAGNQFVMALATSVPA